MLEYYIFVIVFAMLWLVPLPAILCLIVVHGKRLTTAGLLFAWLLISAFVFWLGFIHCFSGCVDPPWYLLASGIASILSGVALLFVFSRWTFRGFAGRSRPG